MNTITSLLPLHGNKEYLSINSKNRQLNSHLETINLTAKSLKPKELKQFLLLSPTSQLSILKAQLGDKSLQEVRDILRPHIEVLKNKNIFKFFGKKNYKNYLGLYTDFSNPHSNVEMAIAASHHLHTKELPYLHQLSSVNTIPHGNVDLGSLTLLSLFKTLGQQDRISTSMVVDPGVGNGKDRAVLITPKGYAFAPNTGNFGLLSREYSHLSNLFYLDVNRLVDQRYLQLLALNTPAELHSKTFHGRELFQPGAVRLLRLGILGLPELITAKSWQNFTNNTPEEIIHSSFSQGLTSVNKLQQQAQEITIAPDLTYGNAKTNITITPRQLEYLRQQQKSLNLEVTSVGFSAGNQDLSQIIKSKFTIPFHEKFSDARGDYLAYLGSTPAPGRHTDDYFLELALGNGSFYGGVLGQHIPDKHKPSLTLQAQIK